jgi:hypothetical protein
MPGHDDQHEGTHHNNDCGAPGSAEAHLEAAEAKLERAHEERAEADRDEREVLKDIQEAEKELEGEHHHLINFTVDGEDYETKQREWTPNAILEEFPKLDPAKFYLAQITGKEPIRYEGEKGKVPIKLHECEAFQAIPIGPATVSDGQIRTGVTLFLEGLVKLGFKPTQLLGHPDHVVIDYVVPDGKFAGKAVKHGFIVPGDFPMTPPSGPHVSPHIHPIKPNGQHPTGGVHLNHSKVFQQALGGAWQYWSRPFPEWPRSTKTAAAYIGHVFKLWATQ